LREIPSVFRFSDNQKKGVTNKVAKNNKERRKPSKSKLDRFGKSPGSPGSPEKKEDPFALKASQIDELEEEDKGCSAELFADPIIRWLLTIGITEYKIKLDINSRAMYLYMKKQEPEATDNRNTIESLRRLHHLVDYWGTIIKGLLHVEEEEEENVKNQEPVFA